MHASCIAYGNWCLLPFNFKFLLTINIFGVWFEQGWAFRDLIRDIWMSIRYQYEGVDTFLSWRKLEFEGRRGNDFDNFEGTNPLAI